MGGSFFGLQRTNRAFRPFEERLHQGQHLFFVDVKNAQEPILVNVVSHHPRLQDAGTGPGLSAAAGLAATLAAVPADGLSGGACAPRRSCGVPPAARISGYPPAIPAGAARQETP